MLIPAEYEDAMGGQVNLVSKSGTNSWHGSVFENHQNSAVNARLQTVPVKPHLTFNQFGGSFGGAVKKNRIFVFGDYEGYRLSSASFVQGNVPTAAIREQLTNAVPEYRARPAGVPPAQSAHRARRDGGNLCRHRP